METMQAAVDCSLEMITEDLGLQMVSAPCASTPLRLLGENAEWKEWCGKTRSRIAVRFALVMTRNEILLLDWRSGKSAQLATSYTHFPRAVQQQFLEHPLYNQIPCFVGTRAQILQSLALDGEVSIREPIGQQLDRAPLAGTLLWALTRQAIRGLPNRIHYAI